MLLVIISAQTLVEPTTIPINKTKKEEAGRIGNNVFAIKTQRSLGAFSKALEKVTKHPFYVFHLPEFHWTGRPQSDEAKQFLDSESGFTDGFTPFEVDPASPTE
jgi:hypothetical protein